MKTVDEYIYRDEDGSQLFKVLRQEGTNGEGERVKNFPQLRRNCNGWKGGLKDTRRVLYRLPELLQTDPDSVFVVAGEKDVENLREIGFTGQATTNPGGEGKWTLYQDKDEYDDYGQYLEGRRVVIIPDNDEAGESHAQEVARDLHGRAESVRILELPDLPEGGDVSDWIENGGTKDKLIELARDCEEWTPKPDTQKVQNPQKEDTGGVFGYFGDFHKESERELPEIIPLGLQELPEFPLGALPDTLEKYAENLAEHTQTPVGLPATLALSFVSVAVAKKAKIQVKKGYSEPLIVWTAPLIMSGGKKTPVFKKLEEPIPNYVTSYNEEHEIERQKALHREEILEKKLDQKKGEIQEQDTMDPDLSEIEAIQEKLNDHVVPPERRLIASDCTTEEIASLLMEHRGKLGVLSTEGEPLKIAAGRYGNGGETNTEVWKKGWSAEDHRVDRVSRETQTIESPHLVVGCTIQPGVLENIGNQQELRSEGTLARFLYCYPELNIGYRKTGDDVPDLNPKLRRDYRQLMRELLEAEGKKDTATEIEPHVIPLSEEAYQRRNEFEAEVEKMLRPGGQLEGIEDWGNKLVGTAVRIAGLFHLVKQAESEKVTFNGEVSRESMNEAIRLAKYYVPHARKALQLMQRDDSISLAQYIAGRLQELDTVQENGEITRRDLFKATQGKSEITKVEDLEYPLTVLEEHNMIRIRVDGQDGPGRPSQIVGVHPSLVEGEMPNEDTQKVQNPPLPYQEEGESTMNAKNSSPDPDDSEVEIY